MSDTPNKIPQTEPHQSATFDKLTNSQIRRAAATGIYDIRGGGAKRKLPHFDDLLFLGASVSRYPLEGYREKCGTDVVHLVWWGVFSLKFSVFSLQVQQKMGCGRCSE